MTVERSYSAGCRKITRSFKSDFELWWMELIIMCKEALRKVQPRFISATSFRTILIILDRSSGSLKTSSLGKESTTSAFSLSIFGMRNNGHSSSSYVRKGHLNIYLTWISLLLPNLKYQLTSLRHGLHVNAFLRALLRQAKKWCWYSGCLEY